jgi:ribonuclease BN (tRNA processing enzyme)
VRNLTFEAVAVNHPGGCQGFLVSDAGGTIAFSGDTAPTTGFWEAVRARGDKVRHIVVETSFPDRLQSIADLAGHLTPRTLAGELEKLGPTGAEVWIHAEKAPTREETRAELAELPVQFLEPGMVLET